MKNKVLKYVLTAFLSVAGLVVLMFAVLILLQYRPQAVEEIARNVSGKKELSINDTVKIMSWNIGYAGLGENADFFMDGGKMVYSSTREEVKDNLLNINELINDVDADVVFLQEVDRNSSRTFYNNETEVLKNESKYNSTFANNYKALFVPYPIPFIGHVDSGLYTLQKYAISTSERIQLFCPFNWFVRAFNLRRCVMVNRIPISDSNKELVVINLHLEAYDSGEGKLRQTQELRDLMAAEITKGNYVVAGGDFNQIFANLQVDKYPVLKEEAWRPAVIDASSFGSFNFVTDDSKPTCRSLDMPYSGADKENFQFYVIDGFLVSDNINVESILNLDQDFAHSDHNPLLLEISFK